MKFFLVGNDLGPCDGGLQVLDAFSSPADVGERLGLEGPRLLDLLGKCARAEVGDVIEFPEVFESGLAVVEVLELH